MSRQPARGDEYDVEADSARRQIGPPGEKIRRRAADSRPLTRAKRLRRCRLCLARLDLDEDDQVEASCDEVDFPDRGPQVAGDDAESLET